MDLTAIFSNDQIAVLGCFFALAACGMVAALSFHFGSAGKRSVLETRSQLPFRSQRTESDGTREKRAA